MLYEVITPTDAELRQRLTPLQYQVTREDGTEPAFANAYWDNHEPGIYVDIISGSPLCPGRWLFTLVTAFALACSAIYEFIEWWAALLLGQGADAFLGMQGDPWA